jgi:RNA polymerase sigma factor (sigma-70 family)
MAQSAAHIDPQSLLPHIAAYRAGEAEAGDRLAEILRPVILLDVSRFLGDNHPDREDVCQDSIIASLRYLKRDQGFSGNLVHLSVTIARNRCRDLLRRGARHPETDIEPLAPFLADPGRTHLDELDDRQMTHLLQRLLDRISLECRLLLKALYFDSLSPNEVKELIGLKTVQGVYHRRSVCLASMKKLLQPELGRRSGWVETSSRKTRVREEGQSSD